MFRFALPALLLVAIATQTEAQNAGNACANLFPGLMQAVLRCFGEANGNQCAATDLGWTITDAGGVVTFDTDAFTAAITATMADLNLSAEQQTAITDSIDTTNADTCLTTDNMDNFAVFGIIDCITTACNAAPGPATTTAPATEEPDSSDESSDSSDSSEEK